MLSQSPLKVEVVGTLGVRSLFFLVPSLLFLLFDSVIPSLAVGLKTQGASALPTRTGGVQGARRGRSRPKWYLVLGVSLFNIALGVAVQAGVESKRIFSSDHYLYISAGSLEVQIELS